VTTPEDVKAIVGSIVEESDRLGLAWTIRPGVVMVTTGSAAAAGVFDGDTVEVPLIDLVGTSVGDRVYILEIKEGGNYIIGSPAAASRQARQLDANVSITNPAASSGAVGTEAAVASGTWLNEPTYRFDPGQMYALDCHGVHSPSALGQAAQVRIRQGSATITGTLIWIYTVTAASIFAPEGWAFRGYLMNNTSSLVSTKLSMSVVRSAGAAGAHTIGGAANQPLLINVSRIGTVAANPGLALVATSVA
jgi:hypothetical protein